MKRDTFGTGACSVLVCKGTGHKIHVLVEGASINFKTA
jgi:hypothetical protein